MAAVTEGDVRFAMDDGRKVVVAAGTERSLAVVEAFLNRLDTDTPGTAPRPHPQRRRCSCAWYGLWQASPMTRRPRPRRTWRASCRSWRNIGVTNLTMAAQMVVNVTEGEKFSASGSAKVNEPCTVNFTGMLGDMGPEGLLPTDQPPLRLEITATRPRTRMFRAA